MKEETMEVKRLLIAAMGFSVAMVSACVIQRPHSLMQTGQGTVSDHSTQPGTSAISAPLNLQRLTESASIVAVGRVAELSVVTDEPKTPHLHAVIVVNEILKGSLSSRSLLVDFTRKKVRVPFTKTITSMTVGLFFLNPGAQDTYSLADSEVEALPAVENGEGVLGNALDRVINVLGNVLDSPVTSISDRLDAIKVLSGTDVTAAIPALRRGVTSNDSNLKLQAEAGLLRHNDLATLKELAPELLDGSLSGSTVILSLSAGIRDGIRSPEAVPILTKLLTAREPLIRRASIHALREIGTVTTWTPVASALNDNDQMVRYDAVAALAQLTGDVSHEPSFDAFQRDEKMYLVYWRERLKGFKLLR
jgi:hypothetical protein